MTEFMDAETAETRVALPALKTDVGLLSCVSEKVALEVPLGHESLATAFGLTHEGPFARLQALPCLYVNTDMCLQVSRFCELLPTH